MPFHGIVAELSIMSVLSIGMTMARELGSLLTDRLCPPGLGVLARVKRQAFDVLERHSAFRCHLIGRQVPACPDVEDAEA